MQFLFKCATFSIEEIVLEQIFCSQLLPHRLFLWDVLGPVPPKSQQQLGLKTILGAEPTGPHYSWFVPSILPSPIQDIIPPMFANFPYPNMNMELVITSWIVWLWERQRCTAHCERDLPIKWRHQQHQQGQHDDEHVGTVAEGGKESFNSFFAFVDEE